MKTTAVSITATQWNPAAPLECFKRFAMSIHEQAKAVLVQDGRHTEMFFFMPLNGQGHLVQWTGKDREQEAAWLRHHVHEHYVYGLIHVVEAWVHIAQKPGDHTLKQLMAGEMTVSQLKPADKTEALVVSAQTRDGWTNCWVDSFTKDRAGKIILGGAARSVISGEDWVEYLAKARVHDAANMNKSFPESPSKLPDDLLGHIVELAERWKKSGIRPVVRPEVLKGWDEMIAEWCEDESMPLFIRKGGSRGQVVMHHTGRKLVITDNSPAQWSCFLAVSGYVLGTADVKKAFSEDAIPIALTLKAAETKLATYKCKLGKFSVNSSGWKACHYEAVGLNSRIPLEQIGISILRQHFIRLISPSNHFLLPMEMGGLGEVPEFIKAMRSN